MGKARRHGWDLVEEVFLRCPLGFLAITGNAEGVSQISFLESRGKSVSYKLSLKTRTQNPHLLKAKKELQEYFAAKRDHFTFPLALNGTAFQQAVWKELLNIPFGQTDTYGEIAKIGRASCRERG